MKKRSILLTAAIFSTISVLITVATYLINIWLFSSSEYLSPTGAFFVEGAIFLLSGVLLLLGRGGINLWSQKAAILSALAEAVYGGDTVGPAETFRREGWRPKGFLRASLVLILTGVLMILIYFLAL